MKRSIAAVNRVSWVGLEDPLLISRHNLFNSIRIKEMRKSGFRGMLIYQIRLKENTAILNYGLLFWNVIGDICLIKQ